MKYIHVYPMLLVFVFHTACRLNQTNSPKDNIKYETTDIAISPRPNTQDIDTKFEYTDSTGKRLIIQNGFPRGGIKYTDPNGGVYTYAIFWTQIINETDTRLELKFQFPADQYEVPTSPGKYYKILVPPDTMTLGKLPLFNYGLTDVKSFFDTSIYKPSSLKRSIYPNESGCFYVILLCPVEGANGTLRTGLSLKGQDLFYRIKNDGSKTNTTSSDKEITCGSINLKNLILQK